MCASGRWIVYIEATLLDGNLYEYPCLFFPSQSDADFYLEGYLKFAGPNNYVGYFGEWFNYTARKLYFDKMTYSDFLVWLLVN